MKSKHWLTRKSENLFSALSGLAGGLLLGQFPQYLSQYLQRLGGHIDEARNIMDEYRIAQLENRIEELEAGFIAIQNANPGLKLFAFIWHADWKIARGAWENFTPGITFDQEGFAYLIVGGILGFLLFDLLKTIFNAILRLFQ